jgi:hypothetical protein
MQDSVDGGVDGGKGVSEKACEARNVRDAASQTRAYFIFPAPDRLR